ncbi:MJ0042 family finger-like domain-containing protein [Albimonas donghaensis]|uniref:MJ0042 family finger-like domain-containing protein n=1 Tax=Albimonas donghaensis TaxID=356660 RepID=A0A1H2VDI6_9RHOB|nr:zinc-ribbon domain-containing protein [Albimonas donghaensis]SDW66352.1 MJ0042 family finger-like domain-containing protein [Albimonas donghaensis]
MRVTCPSCQAVYDAPDDALGAGGRRVECSACGEQWFQPGPELAAFEPSGSRMPGMEAAAESLSGLRDPEPTLADPVPAVAPAPAPSVASEPPAGEPVLAPPASAPDADQAGLDPLPPLREHPAARRPASIDAERLSAELRARDETAPRGSAGGGFGIGLLLALILSAGLAFAYLQSGKVVAMVPQAEPYIGAYVQSVDRARMAVERAAAQAGRKIDELTGGA